MNFQRFLGLAVTLAAPACLAAGLLTAGCESAPKPPHLDVAESPTRREEDEWIEAQRRLHIQYYDASGNLVDQKDAGAFEALGAMYAQCMTPVSADASGNACWHDYLLNVSFNICVARSALALATAQSQALTFSYNFSPTSKGTMVIDKMTEANSAEVAAYGADYARYGVDYALKAIQTPPSECKTIAAPIQWTGSAETPARSMAQVFAAGAVEAYYLVRAGYDKSIEATVNVSDSARSSTPSLPLRIGRSTLGAAFSRAAAAHLLVGGDAGILGSTTKGYCSNPPLSPQARQALDLIRDAAPQPAMVTGTGDIQSLIYATNTEGSIRQRLGYFHGISALGATLPAGQPVEAYYGLDEKDFVQARDYLRQEIDVFSRSPTAKQTTSGTYLRYAGTGGTGVRALPTGAWSARARFSSNASRWYDRVAAIWPIAPNGFDSVENNNNTFPPLDTFIGQVHSVIRKLVRTSTDHFQTTPGTAPNPTSKEVLGVLGSIVASNEYKGTVELLPTSTNIAAAGHGYASTDKLRVMVGEDGLRCAVEGGVEGANCADALTGAQYASGNAACVTKPASLACLTAVVLTGDHPASWFGTTSYTGDSVGRNIGAAQVTSLITSKTRLYVVKLKAGATTETPGSFELLGGSTIVANDDVAIPVVAEMDSRVARILAPDRHNCVVQSTSCVGKTLDERLPLENELTDNGDAVENSWRHYLDLARQAASESDALGKQFQDAKLSKLQSDALAAQRKEEQQQAAANALDEVQTLCGTNLDSRKVLESFSGGPGQNNLDEVTTTASCPSCTGDGSDTCIGGKCYKNLGTFLKADPNFRTDPDAARLDACLSDGPTSIDNFVTLGDQPLCVYSRTAWPFEACPKDLVGAACPVVSTGSCVPPAGTKLDIAVPLKYFQNNQPVGGACSLLRRARFSRTPATSTVLTGSYALHPNRLNTEVGKLTYESDYGGHFTIKENGTPRWTSGNIVAGRPTMGWPATKISACTGETGLFCSVAGTTTVSVGAFNLRVLRAALAASAIQRCDAGGLRTSRSGLSVTYPYNPVGGDIGTWYNDSVCGGFTYLNGPVPSRTTMYRYSTGQPVLRCSNKVDNWVNGTAYLWPGGNPTEMSWILPNGSYYQGDLNFRGPRANITKPCDPTSVVSPCDDFALEPITPDDKPDLGRQNICGQIFYNLTNGQIASGSDAAALFKSLAGVLPESTPLWKLNDADLAALNLGFGAIDPVDVGAALDGLELLCELDARHGAAVVAPPSVATLSDVELGGAFLQNVADQITDKAALTLFANVPKLASDALMDVPPTGAFPALSGQMGEAVSMLRAALIATKSAVPVIANSLRQIGGEMQNLRASLNITDATKQIIDQETLSMTLNEETICANAMLSQQAQAFTSDSVFAYGFQVAAVADTCINSEAQIAIGMEKAALQQQIQGDVAGQAITAFAQRMSALALSTQQAGQGLEQAVEDVRAALARIDGLRKQAKAALAKALYLNSYQSQAQVTLDSAVGALSDLAQTRYVTALKNAKLMSYYAKRAIEQRLGMALSDMTEDLPLVAAPQSWEGNVCTMGGIQGDQSNNGKDWVAVYGEGFIGDYVDKLQAVVESYNIVNNFHEGKDVAVVSLRDDVMNVRKLCAVPSVNKFVNSADLTASAWQPTNCTPAAYNGVTYPTLNCMAAVPTQVVTSGADSITELAVQGLVGDQAGAPGYLLRFGDGSASGTCSGTTGGCGWKANSALTQTVTLDAGRYRFSWYTKDAVTANTSNGASQNIAMLRAAGSGGSPGMCPAMGMPQPAICLVNSPDATPTASPFVFPQYGSVATDTWKRASVEFVVSTAGSYEIGFGVSQATRPTYQVTVAAPMLETVAASGTNSLMPAFESTDAKGQTLQRKCEDTSGDVFRETSWRRDCVHLCRAGFEGNCNTGPLYCYQELHFGVSQSWLQNGRLFNYSGFAKGNFNYRIDSLALNFVGSGIRRCDNAALPSTCYNAGFVPYSVLHEGPFFVRNATGGDFQAKLFDGHIEHARGLALERYVTNPLSSTDRDLLQDYVRGEFAGRPLDGNFTIRIWDEPGVDFNAIQDVQLVLNYRYWTAFN